MLSFTRLVGKLVQLQHPQVRNGTVQRLISSHALVYRDNGDPVKILALEQRELPAAPEKGEVLVTMLAAPINPADINMIQGVYPVRPPTPAIGGNEGVGRIDAVGDGVEGLSKGDWVVPSFSGWGTWRTGVVCKAADLIRIDNDIDVVGAATLAVNPCTAYRMLKDFENLTEGDFVIQNGANSGVGQSVIQIAKELGLHTVNIVRNRENIDDLVSQLKDMGATHVVTDEFVRKPAMKDLMKSLPKPKLALNCVGGKASAELLKHLDKRGTMVTYGGMSKQPLMVPAGPLIFNDVKLRGYWMTEWNKQHGHSQEKSDMWAFLCDMLRQGTLKPPPHRRVPIADFKDAISTAMEPFTNQKQILIMSD